MHVLRVLEGRQQRHRVLPMRQAMVFGERQSASYLLL
jgi:hypothetical protein